MSDFVMQFDVQVESVVVQAHRLISHGDDDISITVSRRDIRVRRLHQMAAAGVAVTCRDREFSVEWAQL
ncbi:MAG: hypothetical protein QGG36_04280 [Pirellulaceae bacterium]|nr:hypothetical protein [Pirellulaceae bacterium]